MGEAGRLPHSPLMSAGHTELEAGTYFAHGGASLNCVWGCSSMLCVCVIDRNALGREGETDACVV